MFNKDWTQKFMVVFWDERDEEMSKESYTHCLWHHNINTWKDVVAFSFNHLASTFTRITSNCVLRMITSYVMRGLFLFIWCNAFILGTQWNRSWWVVKQKSIIQVYHLIPQDMIIQIFVIHGGCQYWLAILKIVVNFCQINWCNPTSTQDIYLILWDLQETGTTTCAGKSSSLAIFFWASNLSSSHFVLKLYVAFPRSLQCTSHLELDSHCKMEEEKHQNHSIAGSSGPICKWFVTSLPTQCTYSNSLYADTNHPWLHGKIRCKDIKGHLQAFSDYPS